ncbi:potassium channel family protein [Solwaraspora sp. WMMD1047]|nr:potassium channel family protein [Solwaraspora sp. WMMD1047]MDG4832511.1 potassium channel family protein [Solwaraspora sp. WMMD1047]
MDDSGSPAGGWSRFYFAGFSIFTLGVGDYVPGTASAQIATNFAVLSGLFLITLGITYLMQVVSAVVDKRTIAGHIAALGTDPVDILRRNWDGTRFSPMFEQHLTSLTPEVIRLGERHLAYPVLHYFHAETRTKAAPAGLTVLDGVVLILRVGVHPKHRADIAAVEPLGWALRELVSTLTGPFISPVEEPAALPGFDDLASAGLPVTDADTYARAVADCRDHRVRLWGWCVSDGWDDPDLRLTRDNK